jgi:hypothetical protein
LIADGFPPDTQNSVSTHSEIKYRLTQNVHNASALVAVGNDGLLKLKFFFLLSHYHPANKDARKDNQVPLPMRRRGGLHGRVV